MRIIAAGYDNIIFTSTGWKKTYTTNVFQIQMLYNLLKS